MKVYNTALKSSKFYNMPLRDQLGETEFFQNEKGTVFYQDMCNIKSLDLSSLPKIDVLYAEISWARGYEVFQKRAGMQEETFYNDYLDGVKYLIDKMNLPTFIPCSDFVAHYLKAPEVHHMTLNGGKITMAIFNATLPHEMKTNEEVLAYLSQVYDSVWDFSCGYGNTFKGFKYIVGSDIDKKCLNYIERTYLNGNN